MKKIIAMSSVLLGVVFLAGCGQQPVSQTQPIAPAPVAQVPVEPASTASVAIPADWKTYANNKYGYEIGYPSTWKMEESSGTETIDFSPNNTNIKEGDFNFELNVYENIATPGNAYQSAQERWQSSQKDPLCSKTIVANTETLKCILEGPFDCKDTNNIQFHFKRGDTYYEGITMYRCNGKDNGIGEKILSTLKFTK